MQKDIIARKLIKIAKNLVALQENELEDIVSKISVGTKRWKELSKDISKDVADLQKQIDILTEQKELLEKKMKEQYKEFDKQVQMSKLMKEATEMVSSAMSLGENVDEMLQRVQEKVQDIDFKAEKSKQPSYKQAWALLVSTLNGTEYYKYVQKIEASFKKNIVDIKTGSDLIKGASKSWDKDFADFYNERKQKYDEEHPDKPMPSLPKASVESEIRIAGIKDWFVGIGTWIAKQYKNVVSYVSNLIGKLSQTTREAQKGNIKIDQIDRLINKL